MCLCLLRQCWRRCVGCCVVTIQKKRRKNDICNFKKSPTREFIPITVLINSKKFLICTTHFCDYFCRDGIPDGFFKYIYHVGCAIRLHSIISSGLIPGGQKLSNRQTVFSLPVDPMDKEHKDPDTIDSEAPRLAQYMHKAWKRHQDAVCWVHINLAIEKGLKFYQTRSNAIILHETLPAYCIPKVVRMETGEVIYEKVYASPRPPPKISLKHDWLKELGSEAARQPCEEVVQQFKSSQPTLPNPNPDHDRTGRPVVCSEREPRSQEIDTRFSRDSTKLQFGRRNKSR